MNSSAATQQNDELAIRQLVEKWLDASKHGDLATLLPLMADDVIFMVPGKEPFGKETFASQSKEMYELEATSNIQEIEVLGDWAWMRNHLDIKITPAQGEPQRKSGYVLTILKKNSSGDWVISRDANLLT